MNKASYCQKNRDTILNRAKDYYHNNIDFLREKARNKYRKLPEEEKIKKESMQKTDIKTYLEKKQNKNKS